MAVLELGPQWHAETGGNSALIFIAPWPAGQSCHPILAITFYPALCGTNINTFFQGKLCSGHAVFKKRAKTLETGQGL
jgi:hypothetical protein